MNGLRISLLLLLITAIFFAKGYCQDHSHENNLHAHEVSDHRHHIGLALGPVYVLNEKEFAPGIHLHYVYLFELENLHFGTGVGLESIMDEHRHYATSLNLSYFPIHNLTLTVAPGIQFGPNETEFTTHFEVAYEFMFGKFHVGPVFEYAYAKADAHMMLGLHLGLGL